jgi:hypothetical protein
MVLMVDSKALHAVASAACLAKSATPQEDNKKVRRTAKIPTRSFMWESLGTKATISFRKHTKKDSQSKL